MSSEYKTKYKNQHPDRGPRTGPYQKTNAYTLALSKEQIITFVLALIQIILHSVFIVHPIVCINHTILFLLLGFHYAMLALVLYDYIYLTIKDPVDRLVKNQELIYKYHYQEVRTCAECRSQVQKSSHHCMRCNRCTEDFDHHCKFLNNCIGSKNYQPFIRLLFVYSIYCINIIGQGVWTLIANLNDKSIAFQGNQWGIVAELVLTVGITLAVGTLFIFHLYITCIEHTTTFNHIYPDIEQQNQKEKDKFKQFINFMEPPHSGQNLKMRV